MTKLVRSLKMFLTFNTIKKAFIKEPKYRFRQAIEAVYARFVSTWEEVSVFSKKQRARLDRECPLDIASEVLPSGNQRSAKAAFNFRGDTVEAVLMRHRGRNTVCVSSQVGCAMACNFCLTGTLGFKRNLSVDEIINQVLYFSRELKKENQRAASVVFMGMGEPLLNYDSVMAAVRKLNDPGLFGIGARHISISTCGVVPGIKRLAKEPLQLNLSVSLSASDNAVRDTIMPINKTYPIEMLLRTVGDYIQRTRRRVMIEYVLLKDVNDSPAQADSLVKLLGRTLKELYFVNLIRYNPTGRYQPSDKQASRVFKSILEGAGVTVVERYRFGQDIIAACGQLAGRKQGSIKKTKK